MAVLPMCRSTRCTLPLSGLISISVPWLSLLLSRCCSSDKRPVRSTTTSVTTATTSSPTVSFNIRCSISTATRVQRCRSLRTEVRSMCTLRPRPWLSEPGADRYSARAARVQATEGEASCEPERTGGGSLRPNAAEPSHLVCSFPLGKCRKVPSSRDRTISNLQGLVPFREMKACYSGTAGEGRPRYPPGPSQSSLAAAAASLIARPGSSLSGS